MNLTFKNKKGNLILESAIIIFLLVAFALIAINSANIFHDLTGEITADVDLPNESKNIATDLEGRTPQTLDGAFMFALGLVWIFVFISAFRIQTQPIFFVASFILFILLLVGAGYMTEAFTDYTSDSEISSTAEEFPMTTFVLNNLIIVMLVVGGSIAIALFAKF